MRKGLGRVVPAAILLSAGALGCVVPARFGSFPTAEIAALGVAIAAAMVAAIASDGDLRGWRPPRLGIGESLVLVALLALTAVLRLWNLADLPAEVHGDSAECGNVGLQILSGAYPHIFAFSDWYRTPFVSFLPYAASFAAHGVSVYALRLPSAVIGVLAALPLYFIGRCWYGVTAARVALLCYALAHPAIHFARIGLWNIQVTLYIVTVLALLLGALRRRSSFLALLAGLVSGLALYSYTAGRIIPIVALAALGWNAVYDWRRWRQAVKIGFAFVCGVALMVTPLILNYVEHPTALEEDRTAGVSVFSETMLPRVAAAYGVDSANAVLQEQILRTLKGFYALGDASGQYGTDQPMFRWITLFFLAVGFSGAALRFWQPRNFIVLSWLVVSLVLGSVLVLDPPSLTRWVATFPVLYLLIGAGVAASMRTLRRLVPSWPLSTALAILFVAQFAESNLRGYWTFAQRAAAVPGREWDVVKVRERSGTNRDYYLATGPHMLPDSPVMRLFFRDVRTVTAISEVDLPQQLARDTTFILVPQFRRFAIPLQDRFPGIERHVDRVDDVAQVIVYECSVANACRREM